ncbi:MAG: terminase gpA endonuclease subunit [Planctomycetota bacterium]
MSERKKPDPRRLKPGRLVQLLNSTPLGPVIDDRWLRELRAEAGSRIGDGQTVDLLRFTAWLAARRHLQELPADNEAVPGESYSRKKERERERNAEASRTGRDIAPLPLVKEPERRAKAWESLAYFGQTYFPERYPLESSRDQIQLRQYLQETIENGGLRAFALPRGSGKTTDCEVAVLWATMTGRRNFVVLLGASQEAADELQNSIKSELESNDLLAEDWPEVCYPIQRLEGIANRCKGQLCNGTRTQMQWSDSTIVFPSVEGSQASGAIIRMRGLTGRIRGMKFTRPDGKTVRPDLVIGDDVQTDESARSPSQTEKRMKIIKGAVLGLAGPKRKIAAMFPLTVIEQNDLADQLLDTRRHPEFHGFRCKLVYDWPPGEKAKRLWDEYAEVRRRSLATGGDGREATEFYLRNRSEMDEGAVIAWPVRFNPDEASALQHAFNLKIDHPLTFDAEYQNDPPKSSEDRLLIVPPMHVLQSRLSRVPQSQLPMDCDRITSFIDCQQDVLFYVTMGWTSNFAGSVIDYGAFPDQRRKYFTNSDLALTLRKAYPGASVDAALLAGLRELIGQLVEKSYQRQDGIQFRHSRILVDAGYKSHLVYQVCREQEFSTFAMPSLGRAVGPRAKPFAAYEKRPGEEIGLNWMVTRNVKRAIRHCLFDSNWWKSFLFDRFATVPGDPGAITLSGSDPQSHDMLAEHLTAEDPDQQRSAETGRTVTVWNLRPGRDNHWLDGVVGSAVAASLIGVTLNSVLGEAPPRNRRRITAADIPRRRPSR